MFGQRDILVAVRRALEEDIGVGDITTMSIVPSEAKAHAKVVAKENTVVAGLRCALLVFQEIDKDVVVLLNRDDGDMVIKGDVVLEAFGSAQSLLMAERTVLNFIMRLSGIANTTRLFVEALKGYKTQILDTRKTTPGLRVLEKYAVWIGGGKNHRMNLSTGVLIKNNHLVFAPSVMDAIKRARQMAPFLTKVEVEVRTLDEAKEALLAGADCLLLDHMCVEDMAKVVEMAKGKAIIEASGNVTLENIRDIAEAGVDFISTGAITHSARWSDFSMYLSPHKEV